MRPNYYDDIPAEIMKGSKLILDVGAARGLYQLLSRHRPFFLENLERYTGIEKRELDVNALNTLVGDIRFPVPLIRGEKFDLVLAIHVLEHIKEEYWEQISKTLRSHVAPNGSLVIGVPYKERYAVGAPTHEVFNIDESKMLTYFPNSEIILFSNNAPFLGDGANFVWGFLRYIKRRITRHPAVRPRDRLILIWRNENVSMDPL